jgi:ribonuclease HI
MAGFGFRQTVGGFINRFRANEDENTTAPTGRRADAQQFLPQHGFLPREPPTGAPRPFEQMGTQLNQPMIVEDDLYATGADGGLGALNSASISTTTNLYASIFIRYTEKNAEDAKFDSDTIVNYLTAALKVAKHQHPPDFEPLKLDDRTEMSKENWTGFIKMSCKGLTDLGRIKAILAQKLDKLDCEWDTAGPSSNNLPAIFFFNCDPNTKEKDFQAAWKLPADPAAGFDEIYSPIKTVTFNEEKGGKMGVITGYITLQGPDVNLEDIFLQKFIFGGKTVKISHASDRRGAFPYHFFCNIKSANFMFAKHAMISKARQLVQEFGWEVAEGEMKDFNIKFQSNSNTTMVCVSHSIMYNAFQAAAEWNLNELPGKFFFMDSRAGGIRAGMEDLARAKLVTPEEATQAVKRQRVRHRANQFMDSIPATTALPTADNADAGGDHNPRTGEGARFEEVAEPEEVQDEEREGQQVPIELVPDSLLYYPSLLSISIILSISLLLLPLLVMRRVCLLLYYPFTFISGLVTRPTTAAAHCLPPLKKLVILLTLPLLLMGDGAGSVLLSHTWVARATSKTLPSCGPNHLEWWNVGPPPRASIAPTYAALPPALGSHTVTVVHRHHLLHCTTTISPPTVLPHFACHSPYAVAGLVAAVSTGLKDALVTPLSLLLLLATIYAHTSSVLTLLIHSVTMGTRAANYYWWVSGAQSFLRSGHSRHTKLWVVMLSLIALHAPSAQATGSLTAESVIKLYKDTAPDPFALAAHTLYAPAHALRDPVVNRFSAYTLNTASINALPEDLGGDIDNTSRSGRQKVVDVCDWVLKVKQQKNCILVSLTELWVTDKKPACQLQRTLQRLTGMKCLVSHGEPADRSSGVAILWDPQVINMSLHSIPVAGRLLICNARFRANEAEFVAGVIYNYAGEFARILKCRLLKTKCLQGFGDNCLWSGDWNGAPSVRYYSCGRWRGDLRDQLCETVAGLHDTAFIDLDDPQTPGIPQASLFREATENRAGSANRIDHWVAGGFCLELASPLPHHPTGIHKATHWAVGISLLIPSASWNRIPRCTMKFSEEEREKYSRLVARNYSELSNFMSALPPGSVIVQLQQLCLLALCQVQKERGEKLSDPGGWWARTRTRAVAARAKITMLKSKALRRTFNKEEWRALGNHKQIKKARQRHGRTWRALEWATERLVGITRRANKMRRKLSANNPQYRDALACIKAGKLGEAWSALRCRKNGPPAPVVSAYKDDDKTKPLLVGMRDVLREVGSTLLGRFTLDPQLSTADFIAEYLCFPAATPSQPVEHYVSVPTVLRHLDEMRVDKSPGSDFFSIFLLRLAPLEVRTAYATALCQCIIVVGGVYTTQFPSYFHVCCFALLVKANKDPALIMLRRPIALLCRGRTLLEKCLDDLLKEVCEKELADYAMGFRAGARVQDPILICQTIINLSHMRRQSIYLFFVDFSDAYTSVPHEMLIAVLVHLGVHSSAAAVIGRLLQMVVQANTWYGPSYFFRVAKGLMQGAVLSCRCFCLFLEVLCRRIWPDLAGVTLTADVLIKILCWADDIVFFCRNERELRLVARHLETWGRITGMRINVSGVTKTAIASRVYKRGSTVATTCKANITIRQDGVLIRIPMCRPKDKYPYLGTAMSMTNNPDTHHTAARKAVASTSALGRGLRLPAEQLHTLSNAYIAGYAVSKCQRAEDFSTSDNKEVPRREAWRGWGRMARSTPREWFYALWGCTHYYAAHAAGLMGYMLCVWNRPRDSLVYVAATTDLINVLLATSLFISPFHDVIPDLESRRSVLKRSPTGRWLLMCRETGTQPKAGLPMLEKEGYIHSHFPKGIQHLWNLPAFKRIFHDKYTLAGLHYLSDICSCNNSFLTPAEVRNRHPAARSLTDAELRLLINTATATGLQPPNFRLQPVFLMNKVYDWNQLDFLIIPYEHFRVAGDDTGVVNFWLARIAPNQPLTGYIRLEVWEQDSYTGMGMHKGRDLYDPFKNTGRVWWETDLHLVAMSAPIHRSPTNPAWRVIGQLQPTRGIVTQIQAKRDFKKKLRQHARKVRQYGRVLRVDFANMPNQDRTHPAVPAKGICPANLVLTPLGSVAQQHTWPLPWDRAIVVQLGQYSKPCDHHPNTAPVVLQVLAGSSRDAHTVQNEWTRDLPEPTMAHSDKKHKVNDNRTHHLAQTLLKLVTDHGIQTVMWPDGSSITDREGVNHTAFGIFTDVLGAEMTTVAMTGDWSSYAAELTGIYHCLLTAVVLDAAEKLLIVSDCQSAMHSIIFYPQRPFAQQVCRVYSQLVAEICFLVIKLRDQGGEVFFYKVRGHAQIFQNEAADFLAKAGIRPGYSGPSMSVPDFPLHGSQMIYTVAGTGDWLKHPPYAHFRQAMTKVVVKELSEYNSGWCRQHVTSPVLADLMDTARYGTLALFICKVRGDRLQLPFRRWVDTSDRQWDCPDCGGRCSADLSHFLWECEATRQCRADARAALVARPGDPPGFREYLGRARLISWLTPNGQRPGTSHEAAVLLMGGIEYIMDPNDDDDKVPNEFQRRDLRVFHDIALSFYRAWKVYRGKFYRSNRVDGDQ